MLNVDTSAGVRNHQRLETVQKQSSTCCRDCRTKERESKEREVVLGMLLRLLVKYKLLYSKSKCKRTAAEEKQDYSRRAPTSAKG